MELDCLNSVILGANHSVNFEEFTLWEAFFTLSSFVKKSNKMTNLLLFVIITIYCYDYINKIHEKFLF